MVDAKPTVEVMRTLEAKVDPRHTAILAIDMVNDFLDPEGKTPKRAQRPLEKARVAIAPMSLVLERSRQVGAQVVYIQHTTMPDGSSNSGPWVDARSRATFSVEDICLDGTWGQEIIKELTPEPGDVVIKKFRYSGFAGTRLDAYLRARGIKTVVCMGVSTNVCVEATAREAFSLDYYVVYVEDACASWDMDLHDATMRSAGHRYGTVCSSDELFQSWRTSGHLT